MSERALLTSAFLPPSLPHFLNRSRFQKYFQLILNFLRDGWWVRGAFVPPPVITELHGHDRMSEGRVPFLISRPLPPPPAFRCAPDLIPGDSPSRFAVRCALPGSHGEVQEMLQEARHYQVVACGVGEIRGL